MTKLPHENWSVRGIDGPKYKVGPACSVPGCLKFADHAHHIWRRSFLAGDFRWVELWNGVCVQNLTGLCWKHHEAITINEATLEYITAEWEGPPPAIFHWVSVETFGPLSPQPLTLDQFGASQLTIDGDEVPHNKVVAASQTTPEACPACGRRKKLKDELPPGEKRNRASWAVSVPKDERENGADVLDTLELECAKLLEREEHSSHKYFVLAEVMSYFLQSYVPER